MFLNDASVPRRETLPSENVEPIMDVDSAIRLGIADNHLSMTQKGTIHKMLDDLGEGASTQRSMKSGSLLRFAQTVSQIDKDYKGRTKQDLLNKVFDGILHILAAEIRTPSAELKAVQADLTSMKEKLHASKVHQQSRKKSELEAKLLRMQLARANKKVKLLRKAMHSEHKVSKNELTAQKANNAELENEGFAWPSRISKMLMPISKSTITPVAGNYFRKPKPATGMRNEASFTRRGNANCECLSLPHLTSFFQPLPQPFCPPFFKSKHVL